METFNNQVSATVLPSPEYIHNSQTNGHNKVVFNCQKLDLFNAAMDWLTDRRRLVIE